VPRRHRGDLARERPAAAAAPAPGMRTARTAARTAGRVREGQFPDVSPRSCCRVRGIRVRAIDTLVWDGQRKHRSRRPLSHRCRSEAGLDRAPANTSSSFGASVWSDAPNAIATGREARVLESSRRSTTRGEPRRRAAIGRRGRRGSHRLSCPHACALIRADAAGSRAGAPLRPGRCLPGQPGARLRPDRAAGHGRMA
jgi:hypothetical protein